MVVVADTSPLNYLALIGHIDILNVLHNRLLSRRRSRGTHQHRCASPRTRFLIDRKRYAKENRVGLDVVQRLHGVINEERLPLALLRRTVPFTRPVTQFLQRPTVEYRLRSKRWLATWEQNRRIRSLITPKFNVLENGLGVPTRYR